MKVTASADFEVCVVEVAAEPWAGTKNPGAYVRRYSTSCRSIFILLACTDSESGQADNPVGSLFIALLLAGLALVAREPSTTYCIIRVARSSFSLSLYVFL
jgi:hypothetical protein